MRIRTFRFYKGLSAVLPPEVLKMGMSEGCSRQGFCPRCRAADEVASQYNRLAHSADTCGRYHRCSRHDLLTKQDLIIWSL